MDAALARTIDAQVAGAAASHQRLLATLDRGLELAATSPAGAGALSDAACRAPSLLAGWSRGHLLSHIARNAESHVRMFQAATRGEVSEQYPGGKATRDREIDEGSSKSAVQLVADVRTAIYLLEAAWAAATETTWSGHGIKSHADGAKVAIHELVLMRWCETEIHHADLDLGFTWRDLDPLFVRYDLDRRVMAWRARKPMGLTVLPDVIVQLEPNLRLAWFYGRHTVEGVPAPDPY
ncbi:MAG: maleylpyruvate isomerase family mycothiol-dependent enzyme [Actinobacteria bacterium]|nr:maleylpyruvate isomerase family mycothiol-dependent enzyme [Actinomycetota bacterium]NBY58159.1 maleylpyruvate isomerase family mycothiol-dependent enzyme [Actinomycetota bacterium]